MTPLYVGKADSLTGVRGRLREHVAKIKERVNIEVSHVTCRYLTIRQKWEVARAEDVLIRRYDPPWNKMTGFGSHPPGAGRPALPSYLNQWEQQYPRKRSG